MAATALTQHDGTNGNGGEVQESDTILAVKHDRKTDNYEKQIRIFRDYLARLALTMTNGQWCLVKAARVTIIYSETHWHIHQMM